ncbi:MAG: heavy metal translocating P-type ATPase metal-binding domain-containing protein [Flavobacteriales bacterium]|nr:heavy metal translocating P-type ATPase metal-binding domain-containing protein [Flavobacteriales bacterium]
MSENCYHCGQKNPKNATIHFDDKDFCCNGCKTVYEILNTNKLGNYYEFNSTPGIRPDSKNTSQFDLLDTPEIFDEVVDFSEGEHTLVTFKIPVIHCSSCVWVLESLHELNPNIISSNVNFTRKTVQITFKHNELKLSELAKYLTQLGYKPIINSENNEKSTSENNDLIIKLAVAGFCFGNVMLLALPEYIEQNDFWLEHYKTFFRFMMFLLSLPVVFYCASDYFKSAFSGLKNKIINIDIPISIGILVLFLRSCYEAYYDISSGYFDSLCGLLFFMLIGKYFQQRTYQSLSFDRDYKSFYPIAITRVDFEEHKNILLSELKVGDRIIIRNEEIIPADVILIKGNAQIDNSFITGESKPIEKEIGDKIFAGGKQKGSLIECEVIKNVNQSYLTQLWNNSAFTKGESSINNLTNFVSKYFTIIILLITLLAGVYWYFIDISKMFQVITAILIVACPCALALSAPFTLGNMMRIFGKLKFYVKDTFTIEKIAKINHIVFDKTGTISLGNKMNIRYEGEELNEKESYLLSCLLQNSNHPLSRSLFEYLSTENSFEEVENYEEQTGKGISGIIQNTIIKIGSSIFVRNTKSETQQTEVYVSINNETKGKFIFKNEYRKDLKNILEQLSEFKLSLISGDNSNEKEYLTTIFPKKSNLLFNQSPKEKLDFIEQNQIQNHEKIIMLGDGLNDAGALKQSDIGIAIADDINSFTPSSDAILDGSNFSLLPNFIELSKKSITIIKLSFTISFMYNIVGLSFAVSGYLSPLVAAILMPISSISVVSFTSIATWYVGKKCIK